MTPFSTITEAIKELKKGKMLILVDSKDRENQGDLIFPAETITTEKANFLIKECRGLFCVPITQKRAVELDLPLMVSPLENSEKLKCNFTISVDAKTVTSFGISAKDRSLTTKFLADNNTKPGDLTRPGHVFPLMAVDGGVLERNGHTEATIDLIKLAGFKPVGVLSEMLADNGETANISHMKNFAEKHGLKIVSIDDLISYLKTKPSTPNISPSVSKTASSFLQTEYGKFKITIYKSIKDNKEHIALVAGNIINKIVPVRIHSQCITGDTFHSLQCDCHQQLHKSLKIIGKNKMGTLLYLNQEGRGIGLANKIKTYALQEKGLDTIQANLALGLPVDARDYKVAAEMLKDLGASTINLLTNNPDKIKQIEKYGIVVKNLLPLETIPSKFNKKYLLTKKQKLEHQLIKYKLQ